MEKKREVDQEEFVVSCLLCATAIPLYPSPTFAVNRTSSQNARDRNSRGGTQRLLQLLAFFCYSSLRVCLLPSSLTVLCGFLCDQTSFICDQTKWFEGKFFLQFLDMREINFGLLDPLQWWDHRSEKVTEHQSCQNSHVDGAITAFVGVNLVALS
jgi:hypothetical protein